MAVATSSAAGIDAPEMRVTEPPSGGWSYAEERMSTLSDGLMIHLPSSGSDGLEQDQEYFELEEAGGRRRIRFHDYGEIFSVPGLYERLFAELLRCESPRVVVDLLNGTLSAHREDPAELRVVDLGAGNGMVGQELARIGADSIVGVDMLEEAKDAAERDRPGVYDAYHALDLTALTPAQQRDFEQRDFNCLTCVAALGFGDMPPAAFLAAYDFVAPDGWVAFNIRDQFISDDDRSGFARLLDGLLAGGQLVEYARMRYPHRLAVTGESIDYVAVIAQKAGEALQAA